VVLPSGPTTTWLPGCALPLPVSRLCRKPYTKPPVYAAPPAPAPTLPAVPPAFFKKLSAELPPALAYAVVPPAIIAAGPASS
jgi:hypothetical protein